MDCLLEARRLYRVAIEPYKGSPTGATEEEVVALEHEVGFLLPEAYRQYLRWMGKDYHGVFAGSHWFLYSHYYESDYVELVRELSGLDFEKYSLPKNFFLFFHHQAYEAAWFSLPKDSEDPLVYYFNENDDVTVPVLAGAFTHFLTEQLRLVAPLMPQLYEKRK